MKGSVDRGHDAVLVLSQDDEPFHDGRERHVLVGGQLGALARRQQHGRRVRVRARDTLGSARFSDHVHGLTNNL